MYRLLVEPWTYNYYNSHYTNGPNASEADIVGYKGMHTTDVTWNKALGFIDDAAQRGGQFYMQVAPGKCPSNLIRLKSC